MVMRSRESVVAARIWQRYQCTSTNDLVQSTSLPRVAHRGPSTMSAKKITGPARDIHSNIALSDCLGL